MSMPMNQKLLLRPPLKNGVLFIPLVVALLLVCQQRCDGFATKPTTGRTLLVVPSAFVAEQRIVASKQSLVCLRASKNVKDDDYEAKFGMPQRIDSGKSLVLGAIVGSLAQSPVSFVRDVLLEPNSVAQWEFDTDTAAVSAGLFAIVYRYCIRQDDNSQLNQGVVGAFVLVRTLSRVHIPTYCIAIPLRCGPPLSYLDWNILQQLFWSGLESAILFAATAKALDFAMEKGYISRFP